MTTLDARCAALLERRLAREQTQNRLPSVVAGLVRDGSLVWTGAYGQVGDRAPGADTQYRIGSITKTFVAVCVMRLRDAERIDLSDRIDDHVPGTPVGRATVAQLLSHASGVQAETAGPWWERTPGGSWRDLATAMNGSWSRHPPGRRFHYSNVGYAVLGELVARHRGRAWFEVVSEELLEPLGMSRTTTRPTSPRADGYAVHPFADVLLPEPEHDAGAMAPAGQLWSTVADLGRWAAFLAGDTGDLLTADSLAEMREPLVVDDAAGDPWTAAYGLGLQLWNVAGRRSFGHGGSMPGFLAGLRIDAETGDAVVTAANATTGLSAEVTADLLQIVAAESPVPAPAWTPAAVADEVLALVGPWYWGPAPLALHALPDGWLYLRPLVGKARSSRFRPEADGTWTGADGYYAGETLRVVRRDDGSASHLDVASFVLTRRPYDPEVDIPGGVAATGWR